MPLATKLSVRLDALLPLARQIGVVPNGEVIWAMSEVDCELVERAVADLIPVKEAEEILGFSDWGWDALASTGRMSVFSLFATGRRLLRTEVEKVAADILSVASKAGTSDRTGSVRTYARRHGISIGVAFARVLEGELTATLDDGGLHTLRIHADSHRAKLSREGASPDKMVTIGEAAILLALEQKTVARLRALGEIASASVADLISLESVQAFALRYANAQIYRSVLECRNQDVHDRLVEAGVETCFGLRFPNVVVERAAARKALGLARDPDDPANSSPLWSVFRQAVLQRYPTYLMPVSISSLGGKMTSSNRKVALDVRVEAGTDAVVIEFEIHPFRTKHRWAVFASDPNAVRRTLSDMSWESTDDGRGWRLSRAIYTPDDIAVTVEALGGMRRHFK
jgi:hypothetical protein